MIPAPAEKLTTGFEIDTVIGDIIGYLLRIYVKKHFFFQKNDGFFPVIKNDESEYCLGNKD